MILQSKYRLIGKAPWGVAINTSAEWFAVDSAPTGANAIANGIWFACEDKRLKAEELRNLALGVKMVSHAIVKKKSTEKSVLINILEIEYNPTDYQREGLVAASANWAAEAFGFPKPEIIGRYDKKRQKYSFSFEPQLDGESDELKNGAESVEDAIKRLHDARTLLDRGEIEPAAERAGMVVRKILVWVVRARSGKQKPEAIPATIEQLLTVIRSQSGTIPATVMRHGTRLGTWYSDVRYGSSGLMRKEAEDYLGSAEAVVAWAKEVAK